MPQGNGNLVSRFGSAKHPERPVIHARPPGADEAAVAAAGKLSEALETVERARGHLYSFHQLSGHADGQLKDAVAALREAGEAEMADEVEQVLVGRDVVADMWTFQIVEAYDEQYWSAFRGVEEDVRQALIAGRPHVFEGEMKHREQS
ncbi:MAG TPA: hypothetical protein VHX15_20300 [Frankiaceae bacterium]|jgi:hypothetical protein|nr:hypothetical protein [Frankiaceae bacterium]